MRLGPLSLGEARHARVSLSSHPYTHDGRAGPTWRRPLHGGVPHGPPESALSRVICPDGSDPGDPAGRSMTGGPSGAPGAIAIGRRPSRPCQPPRMPVRVRWASWARLATSFSRWRAVGATRGHSELSDQPGRLGPGDPAGRSMTSGPPCPPRATVIGRRRALTPRRPARGWPAGPPCRCPLRLARAVAASCPSRLS